MVSVELPTQPNSETGPPPHRGFLARLTSLLSDSGIYGITSLLGQIVGFLLIPIYTNPNFLSANDLGVMAMLVIAGTLFDPLANLGMTNALFRRYNQAKDDATKRAVLGTGLISVTITSALLYVVTFFAAGWIAEQFVGDASTTYLVRLGLLSSTLGSVGNIPSAVLRADRQVRRIAISSIICLLVSVTVTLYLVAVAQLGVAGWIYGLLAADVMSLAMTFAWTWRRFALKLDRDVWRSMLSYGLPLVPHRLQSVAMGQFGQFMLRELEGLGELGVYSIAARFALPVGMVVSAVQQAWVPFKFELHAQEADPEPYFRSIFTYYFASLSYLWVGVSVWGFDTLRLMTDDSFHSAAALVPLLALIRVTTGVYFMVATGIELTDRTGSMSLVSLVGLIASVASALALVKPLGAPGAALANIICNLAMAAVMYYLAQRRLRIPYDWPTICMFVALAAVCVAVAYPVQSLPLSGRLAFNLLVSIAYPAIGFLILVRSPAERYRMNRLLEKWRQLRGGQCAT